MTKAAVDSVQSVHNLIASATRSHASPIEAMQLTQAALNAANALQGVKNLEAQNTDTLSVRAVVERFLAWRLPADFNPDGGISFKADFNENTDYPMRHEPSGTNLLDYRQAEAMVRHILGLDA